MRIAVPLLVLPLLAGCSSIDWDSLTSFGSSSRADEAVASAAQAPPAQASVQAASAAQAGPAAPNTLCVAVARQDAMNNGFDSATQQRVAQRSYQQCVTIFGNETGH